MVLDYLNTAKSQLWPNTALAHPTKVDIIIGDTSLGNQLRVSLLSCKVNGVSRRTIKHYAQRIGVSATFCGQLGVSEPKEAAENPLISRLKGIPSGETNWRDYQDVCQEVMSYCLVPPLLKPCVEVTDEVGIHRRDIVYPIPGGIGNFWGFIQRAYSATGVVVDAKNYANELPANQVVIVSKYFGVKKLGNFGIVISRKGPSASAKKEQIDRWVHHEDMIVCLSDDDLREMVLMKEISGKPEEILDKKIFEIRKSV